MAAFIQADSDKCGLSFVDFVALYGIEIELEPSSMHFVLRFMLADAAFCVYLSSSLKCFKVFFSFLTF